MKNALLHTLSSLRQRSAQICRGYDQKPQYRWRGLNGVFARWVTDLQGKPCLYNGTRLRPYVHLVFPRIFLQDYTEVLCKEFQSQVLIYLIRTLQSLQQVCPAES